MLTAILLYIANQGDTIVVDSGSYAIKAGFASDRGPRTVFPSIIGSRSPGDKRDTLIGDDAQSNAHPSSVRHPIDNGVIIDWDAMEKIWEHAIRNELGADPKDHPLFFSEPLGNPKPNREKMVQVAFEHLNSPAFFVNNQAVLSLYAAGRSDGIVVDCGECSPSAVHVYGGFALTNTISRADIGGRGLTDYLAKTLSGRGYTFTTATEKELVRDMKETLCYVSTDFEQETQTALQDSSLERSYELPDGKPITISADRFAAPEILFRPQLSGHQGNGVHKATFNTIMKADDDIRWNLCRNIVLAGGTTMFPGFAQRMHKEITSLVDPRVHVEITSLPDRQYSAWIGGTIQASSYFDQIWISKEEYEESGPGIVSRKCF